MSQTPLKRRKPIRQRSKKMAKLYREVRVPLVRKILEERPWCQRCGRRSQTVHELLTRRRGGSITDETNCVALCKTCHDWIHDHPAKATEEGWLISRWAA